MKYLCVSNKAGMPCALFLHKIQILSFGGLGERLNGSLATENPSFRQLTNQIQDYLNRRKKKTVSTFVKINHRQHEERHYRALNHQKDWDYEKS